MIGLSIHSLLLDPAPAGRAAPSTPPTTLSAQAPAALTQAVSTPSAAAAIPKKPSSAVTQSAAAVSAASALSPAASRPDPAQTTPGSTPVVPHSPDRLAGTQNAGKRTTPAGGFWGLLAGTVSSVGMWLWVKLDPSALAYIALSRNARDMAENMYRGLWSLLICVGVTVLVSMLTAPKPEAELKNLVYGLTPLPSEGEYPWYQRPGFWAGVVAVVLIAINIIFW